MGLAWEGSRDPIAFRNVGIYQRVKGSVEHLVSVREYWLVQGQL